MKKLLIVSLTLLGLQAFGQSKTNTPVPKDPFNIPIYGGISTPVFSEATTLTTNSYALMVTLPNTGLSYNRTYRHLMVFNPSSTRSVYICFGNGSCATDMVKVPTGASGFGVALDDYMAGVLYGQTEIWGRLDAAGSVTPLIYVW